MQALDQLESLESETMTLSVEVTDPCSEQIIIIKPLTEEEIFYEVHREAIKVEISVLERFTECRSNFRLEIKCDQGECPEDNYFEIEHVSDGLFIMSIFTENYKFAGLHVVSIMAFEDINGKASEEDSLTINIFDACFGKQELTLTTPEEIISYNLM